MENSNKVNDRLNEIKDVYLKLNKISDKLNEFYVLVVEYKLVNEILDDALRDKSNNIDETRKKTEDLNLRILGSHNYLMNLKADFINDILKNNSNKLIEKGSLESHFKALNPFFTSTNVYNSAPIIYEQIKKYMITPI